MTSSTTKYERQYGPWGIVAGGSDGVGAAFARAMAAHGIHVVLVARRVPVLKELAGTIAVEYGVQVRTVPLDLAAPDALAELAAATADLEIGLFVYNAGSDDSTADFLDRETPAHLNLVRRNCVTVLEAAHHFGAPMADRGRGGVVLVTSGAAWAGGATRATYGATKAFGLVLAESLWAEWRGHGVDVLALVLGRTDTPSLRRLLGDRDEHLGALADPKDVAEEALTHLADGPTWISGSPDPAGASPLGALSRRDAVIAMSRR